MTPSFVDAMAKLTTVMSGVAGFYKPNPSAMMGIQSKVGIDRASVYSTEPLRATLLEERPWEGIFDPLQGVVVHESVEY